MEDTLRVAYLIDYQWVRRVLILVLMEDTLRVLQSSTRGWTRGLNPCFNGRYSQRTAVIDL